MEKGMLKTKVLNSMDISPEELGNILKHFNFTGFYSDSQIKRIFCSCGYEAAKIPDNPRYGDYHCPECKGKLMKEYSWNKDGMEMLRILPDGEDIIKFYKLVFKVDKSSDNTQFLPRLTAEEIGYLKKDVDGNIIEALWPAINIAISNFDETLSSLREFFKANKKFSEVFENYGFIQNCSTILELKILIEGMTSYPNIFYAKALKEKPQLVLDFISWVFRNEFVYPSVDSDSINTLPWCEGDEIPPNTTLKEISCIFGCPEEIFAFNDGIHFINCISSRYNKEVLNYKDISDFFKTPLGIIALNRYMNGIIDWNEMIKMYFVGIAINQNCLYKKAFEYNYVPHKPSHNNTEEFSTEDISIFLSYFKDSIDRYMEIYKVIQHFEKNIEFLRGAGFIPDETNIRDRVCNSIRNSQKYKTLKGTDIQELMKADPLEAASRLRGLL